jgi:23S rRNA (pseudouridine1915-N3)-methyltransferase
MQFRLIAIGKVKDRALAGKCLELLKRLNFEDQIEIRELKDSNSFEADNRRILDALSKGSGYVVVLSEDGKLFSSRKFAKQIENIQQRITFVIGGPYGFSDEVKSRADLLLALSPMTFTHEMARFILLEQIFRATSIIRNRNYHND